MYLRHTTVRKGGKTHTYWRLVRSVRFGNQVRQETVACLGELDERGCAQARALAETIGGRDHQGRLFEGSSPTETVTVRLREIRLERGRQFGDVWLGWGLWRALAFDRLLARLLPAGREEVPWATMAAVLVLARLCEPASELHIAEDWYRRTALDDLLGLPGEKVNEPRLYRALDVLGPHRGELQRHLKERLGTLFALEYDLLLYDVTSVYFEGEAAGNALAQRGYSRDHRPDRKQVCLALVVTRDGMPLGYEVFAGNRTDVTTVEEVVTTMEARYGRADRIWVLDRGMVSEENLAFLRQEGRRYLVGTPKSLLRRFERELLEAGWEAIREGLEVKRCPAPDGEETFILCRSRARREKEKAMHDRFEQRLEAGLTRLAASCGERKLDPLVVAQRVGRLLGQNTRAAGLFRVDVATAEDGRARLRWSKVEDWRRWAALSEGCYLLRSNIRDWDAADLWRTYIQLTEAEGAFRIHKSELRIRPVWHQRAARVEAHILVCFLAYVLWKTLQQWQRRAGLGDSPRTILEELGRIQSADVVLPTTDGREARLRCVVRPDAAQRALLQRLGLELPERLHPPRLLAKM